MDRYKNNSSYKKDMQGIKNKTEKLGSFTKGPSGMTSSNNTKKTSLSMSSNYQHQLYEKPKADRTPSEALYKKKDQNLTKSAPPSVTSFNNSKQPPTKNEYKVEKPKQDQIQLGVPYKGDQNQAKALNSPSNYKEQKPSYNGFSISKSKEDEKKKPEPILTTEYKVVKSKQDQIQLGVPYKGDQNQAKVLSSPSNYKDQKPSYNGFSISKSKEDEKKKPEPILTREYKVVKAKQDQIQLGVPCKGDQNQVLNAPPNYKDQKPSYNGFSILKSKEEGKTKPDPILTKTPFFASQSRDDRKHSNALNYSQFQDNKNNETRKREKFIADYAANIALVRTMKHMWQSPKKGKDANPLKSSSYVASESKSLKYNTDEGAHSLWKEQATGQIKNSVPENFLLTGQSKQDVKANEIIGTETFKSSQTFASAKLKGEIPKDVKEEELQLYLLKEPALTALYAGLPADLIKQAIKEKLMQTGTQFTSAGELIEAVSKLKKECMETLEKRVPNGAELIVVEQEEEKVVDRKMLEEIKMLKQEKMCKICLDGEVGIVFVPCGHLVTCVKCSENIKACPLCRAEIQSTVKTFLS